jgi:hypothetical protein
MKINLSTIIAVTWTVYLGSCIYNMASGIQPTWVSVICPATLLVLKCWMDVICDKAIESAFKSEDNQDR